MTTNRSGKHKERLEQIARRVMLERGFAPDFSQDALDEVNSIKETLPVTAVGRDLRNLPWCSIDNDDSLDLDQLTVAIPASGRSVRILVAVADVASLVRIGSQINNHAGQNTTSVYTVGKTFHMLPEELSTDLTSLNYERDRSAIVIDMLIDDGGTLMRSDIYSALVRNHAKLAYNSLADWLEGKKNSLDEKLKAVPSLVENIRIQDRMAQKLMTKRQERGALELQTLEPRAILVDDEVRDLKLDETNRAREIIQDFMIAANDSVARYLHGKRVLFLRRVVRSPRRWERIVEIAAQYKYELPRQPDARALADFLGERKAADPVRFPDLSLVIIKLLGPGEYVVEQAEWDVPGHFGLAVKHYSHSTAPNRRYPDLVTQRVLKAVLNDSTPPYQASELVELARHCTEKEDDANKVERLVAKSAAAMLLSSRIGETFDAICTGAADKGTWVRIFKPPIEGRLLYGYSGVDVGERLQVRLVHTDIDKGFIDFSRVSRRS